MKLRVALYGNIANNFGELASALALTGDIAPTLLLDAEEGPQGQATRPGSVDYETIMHGAWLSKTLPKRSQLVRFINSGGFDAFICSGTGISMLPYISCPTVAAPIGFDLTVLPLRVTARNFLRVLGWDSSGLLFEELKFPARLFWGGLGYLQYRGLLSASKMLAIESQPFREAAERLSIDGSRIARGEQAIEWVPRWIPIDTDVFSHQKYENWPEETRQMRAKYSYIVFHPSRLMMRTSPERFSSGQWKNSGAVIRGFADFVTQLPEDQRSSVCLALLDRPSKFSPDIGLARDLIRSLGIERNIEWIAPPPGKASMDREELISWYSAADAGIGSLGRPWYGSVAVEFLSCGVPLIANFDPAVDLQFWGQSFPALRAWDKDSLCANLKRLYSEPELRSHLQLGGRSWVEMTHSHRALGRLWAGWLQEVA